MGAGDEQAQDRHVRCPGQGVTGPDPSPGRRGQTPPAGGSRPPTRNWRVWCGPRTSVLELNRIGPSGAARLLVEVADITRFPDKAHFASRTGIAPIDATGAGARVLVRVRATAKPITDPEWPTSGLPAVHAEPRAEDGQRDRQSEQRPGHSGHLQTIWPGQTPFGLEAPG